MAVSTSSRSPDLPRSRIGLFPQQSGLNSLLRRANPPAELPERLSFGDVSVDFLAYEATKGGEAVHLTPREFELLRYLAGREGEAVERFELLREVWGFGSHPTTRTVDNHVCSLRAKLEDESGEPRHLLTVHGVGYRFVRGADR